MNADTTQMSADRDLRAFTVAVDPRTLNRSFVIGGNLRGIGGHRRFQSLFTT